MAAASVMLASCSNEEALDVNKGRAIEFRQGMQSRAADINNSNLQKFQAYAYVNNTRYFGPVEFTKGEETNTFSSDTSYYWPGDGSTVTFTAFAPSTIGATVDNGTVSLVNYKVNDTPAAQEDFIVGTGSGTKAANEGNGVILTFNHMLSMIEIKAKSSNTTYDFEISGVRIVNIPNQGSYNGAKWELAEGADMAKYEVAVPTVKLGTTESLLMSNDASLSGKTNANSNLILIPQQLTAWEPDENRAEANPNTGAYIAVKLKVTSKQGGVQIFPFEKDGKKSEWAAVAIGTKWEIGKKYTYILDFTKGAGRVEPGGDVDPEKPIFGDPITFTVDVTDWSVEDAGDQKLNMSTKNEENAD